jgi:hypothetical protein
MKKTASLMLALAMAAPPMDVVSAPELGTIKGAVTVSSRPISGVSLAFVDLASGNIYRAKSEDTGAFSTRVPAGRYVLTTENGAGLAVGRAPSLIAVAAGQVATADVDLAPIAGATVAHSQEPSTPGGQLPTPPGGAPNSTTILHDPIGCFVAGQFPLVDSQIEPAGSVARARVYFKAAGSENWYYVEMTPAETGFLGKLPRPKLEASPITYYVQASTTDFGENRTPEIEAIVVAEAKDCPEDKKVAGIGPPGEVTVFSAATGAAIAPVGFAAGGLALTAGTLALILGGAAAIGIGTAVVTNDDTTTTTTPTTTTPPILPSPSPSPSPLPSASPTPGPVVEPTPCPGCPPDPAICTIVC